MDWSGWIQGVVVLFVVFLALFDVEFKIGVDDEKGNEKNDSKKKEYTQLETYSSKDPNVIVRDVNDVTPFIIRFRAQVHGEYQEKGAFIPAMNSVCFSETNLFEIHYHLSYFIHCVITTNSITVKRIMIPGVTPGESISM